MNIPSKFVGIPFVLGGRDFNGCDCWGLLRLAYKEFYHIDLPLLNINAVVSEQIKEQNWLPRIGKATSGDVLTIRVNGWPIHIALVIDNALMLHTTENSNSRIERFLVPLWKDRIVGLYRHPQVD